MVRTTVGCLSRVTAKAYIGLKQTSKRTFDQAEWEAKLKDAQVTKDDLNRIVMDYLVTEGYKAAADEFCKEANMAPPAGLNRIDKRIVIRDAVQRGDIQEAIQQVNEFNPEILDANPSLYFHLQQQRLIEYIRAGRTTEALQFAQSELAPRGFENPEFLSELERTMALLAFDQVPDPPADIAELLLPAQRTRTASELNAAILASMGQGVEPKLVGLMRLLAWGENLLEEKATFPRVDLSTVYTTMHPLEELKLSPGEDDKVGSHGFNPSALASDEHAHGSKFLQKLRTWGVESRGIYPVAPEHRTDPQFSKSFFVWLSCNLNILSFSEGALGTLVYGLTFRQSVGVIVGFTLLSAIPPAYFSTFGPKLGLRQMVHARYSFGWFGAVLPAALSVLGGIGYNILNAILGGQTLSVVSGGRMSWNVGIVIISLISLLASATTSVGWVLKLCQISFIGYRIVHWYERVAWFPVLVVYIVLLGVGGRHLTEGSAPPGSARSVLSFASTVAGFTISYAPIMSDYTSYMRADVASYLGLVLPTVGNVVGAAFGASMSANGSWSEGYAQGGAGGLVGAGLEGCGGFGKFLTVVAGLSVIGNMVGDSDDDCADLQAPTLYSFSIDMQIVLPFAAGVPRYVFSVVGTAVVIPLAVVGSTRLGIVGYWVSTFVAIVLVEHVFRREYDIAHWNSPGQLPPGLAALGAIVCAFGAIVPCMDQVWFVGPVAERTGDIGFEEKQASWWECGLASGGENGWNWSLLRALIDDDDMAAVDVDAQTPRRRGRRAIKLLVVANPDGSSSSDEDTPADTPYYYPATARQTAGTSPRTLTSPPRTLTSPSPTSYVSASGSSARSSNSPGPESTPPPPTPSQVLPPLDLGFAKPKTHVTPNLPVGEDSDNGEAESSRRAQTLRSASERIIVAVTHDAENYVVVDLTGHTEAQAIRERILSKLHIPDDLHASFAIYRTELGGFAIGAALDDNQLLIDCQHFGDDKGSLKFLAQRADAPAEAAADDVAPLPTIAPVPPMLPSLSSFSPGPMRMPSSRRPGSASPASDRLASNGYEASVSAVSDFEAADAEIQTRSPIQTLHRQAASRRGRQPSTSWRVRRRGSGSATSDMSPVAPASSPESGLRPQERRGSVTPTPATRSPPDDAMTHARRTSEPDSAYERDLALAAEERRRDDERERWAAKQKAELAAKRQQWALDHPGRTPANGYTSAGSVPRAVYPQRTGSPARVSSRRPDGWSQGDYRPFPQPQAPVRQQDPYYRQPQRPRQPSPNGFVHSQSYPYTQYQYSQQPYPPQSYHPARTVPPGPPRGAMLPRTPGSEYIAQATQWSDRPNNTTIGAGIAARAPSPQLRGGARSMGNLRESFAQPAPPPPPPPAAQWSAARGPSPAPQLPAVMSPPQVLSPMASAPYDPHRQQVDRHDSHRQPSHDSYRHASPSHTSPHQQPQPIPQPLPPPSMQQYQQQGARMPPVDQRTDQRAYAYEPQRTGPTFEPQRTGYTEPQRTGYIEPQRTGYIEPQRTGGAFTGYDRYERERQAREREKYEIQARERKEHDVQRTDQRPSQPRQQTGTSPSHTSSRPAEPVPRPDEMRTAEFSTSPRPAPQLANWGAQGMAALNRPAEPPYYANANALLARRTFSGDAIQQQQRPQSAYDPPPSLRPGVRPPMQRPVTEYDRPPPSDLYRPPPLPQTPQHTTSPPVANRYPQFNSTAPLQDGFQRRILDERVDDLYGGMEETSPSPLSLNTTLAPPTYRTEPEAISPSSLAGEPSPVPQTPEPDHSELDDSRTASPSASDASTVGYTGHTRDTDSDRDSTTAVSDAAEGTLKADDYRMHMAAIARMVNGEEPTSLSGNGAATPPAPAPLPRAASQPTIPPATTQPYVPPPNKIISRDFAVQEEEEYDDSDEDSGTLWQVPKQNSTPATSVSSGNGALVRRTATRPKGLRLRIDGSRPSSQPDSSPASTQDSAGATLLASTLPLDVRKKTNANANAGSGSGSGSGGDVPTRPSLLGQQSSSRGSQSWDLRPQAEEVYEKLDQFFPNHDLDKPVIDAPSGGTSPVTTEAPPIVGSTANAAPLVGPGVRRHKKSIRVVAAERKKMLERINAAKIHQPPVDEATYVPDSDGASNAGTIIPVSSILRKRSTKMWGGRVEEVTPGSALGTGASPNVPETIPEGPGRQRPTFKWVKGQLIGRGSFGRVYHAMNLTTGEMIAVKQVELPKTDSDRADSRQMSVVDALKSESDTLRDLDHPHIVQYLGFEETMDAFSIFLEYVPGGSVGSVLRKFGKFEDEVVRSFSRQIIDGLAYLHKSGILHRDLKGDNILVDRSGICKISDFGISKRSEHVYNNHEGTAMQGSVFWMAPEMLHNNKQGYNAKIDIWSVGCVVLEMQAGRRPWTEDDMFAVMYKVGGLRQAPPVPNDVYLTPLADDFRQRCFAVLVFTFLSACVTDSYRSDPAERPTAAELLTHSWLQLPLGWTFPGFKER
ncbi:Mitogen-activated protein kinase kinase kinase [Ceratobasidium theobromae]|uniref:Mitogen-activated protein kinase kinase kinase n=1 Tax=Ceratobasidium theobromae TaxID=1582974 RepID=A0A5N5QRX4_9AGAM|nr:Mitogen-activated protein kinase kinase kinase [Ceratobasidium theobromae]